MWTLERKRRQFFEVLASDVLFAPPPLKKLELKAVDSLKAVVAPPPRRLTKTEEKMLCEQEEVVLRQLRMYLRSCVNEMMRDRKFSCFFDDGL